MRDSAKETKSEGEHRMKARHVLLAAGITALIASAPAGAETRTLTGSVSGHPGSRLIVKIQRLGGSPFRVTSFEFRRLNFTCFGATPSGRINGKVGRMKIEKRSNPFNPLKLGHVYFSGRSQTTLDKKVAVFITGVTDQKARTTRGNLGISFGDGCSADPGTGFSKFTASR